MLISIKNNPISILVLKNVSHVKKEMAFEEVDALPNSYKEGF
ncbi:MAG: hypothetical protein OES15_00165 [Nitrosopumilus sp.]|nr:hypothetical protein [Nitrosopumilus sp.]MDH3853158.1 hypothetical protein [Nitrosopumilus sp.]